MVYYIDFPIRVRDFMLARLALRRRWLPRPAAGISTSPPAASASRAADGPAAKNVQQICDRKTGHHRGIGRAT